MRKFSKVILFVLIGVLGIILAALIGVNLWLQSTGVQSRLQEKVESVLGVTIHVKSTFYTPWGGVRLSGLVIPDPSSKQPANFLEAQSFALRFDLIPLIKRHFVISQVALDNPILIWRQSEDGKWRLPTFAQKPLSLPPTTPGIPPLAPAPAPVPSIQIPAPQAPATVEQPANQEISKKSSSDFLKFLVEIHQVRINQGQGTFIDSKGEILATFTDLKIHAEVRSNNNISGQIHIADLAFRNRLHVRHFRAHFTKKINLLSSSDVTAHLAEGRMTGQVSVEMNSAPTFQTSIELKNVQLRSLMTEAGIDPGTSSGIILGNVALGGTLKSENDI
ncbi:MAG: hypothetical protein ABI615_13600, partial [Chthoniobacterales bacterium]